LNNVWKSNSGVVVPTNQSFGENRYLLTQGLNYSTAAINNILHHHSTSMYFGDRHMISIFSQGSSCCESSRFSGLVQQNPPILSLFEQHLININTNKNKEKDLITS
jgi:hypothetical protein